MSTRLPSLLTFPLSRVRSRRFSTRRISWGVRALCGVLAVCWLLHAPDLAAKKKAPVTLTVTGMVTDKDEKGISGATVTLKDLQTGKSVAIYTDTNGQYQFSDLDPDHDYQIHAGFNGMVSETRRIGPFETRRKLVINLAVSAEPNKQ